MKELEQYRACMKNLPKGCVQAEAEAEKQQKISVTFYEGKAGGMSCSEQTELFVRASGEKTGMTYTQKLDEDPYEVIARALKNSEVSENTEREIMTSPAYWENAKVKQPESGKEASIEELIAFAEELEKKMQELLSESNQTEEDKKVKKDTREIGITVSQVIRTMGLVNSNGVDVTAVNTYYEAEVTGENGYEGFLSASSLKEIKAEYFAQGIKKRRMILLPKKQAVPKTYRAVLSPETMNFILITAWQMFSAPKAQQKATPLSGKLGQKVFADNVTICDYKNTKTRAMDIPGGFAWEMDCEGVPCQDVTVVENGVLKQWMYNLSSAKKDKTDSNGCAGRKALLSGNIHTDTVIVPKTFTFACGDSSLEELFEACGDGIYIYECYDQFHSLSIASGEFAFPCKGLLLEKGKPAALLEGLTMNGNVCELFAGIEKVGNAPASYVFPIYQNYEVCSPAVLVKKLRISG